MNIKWDELGFGYMPVRSNIRFHYENGKWSEAELTNDSTINISIAANCIHYGMKMRSVSTTQRNIFRCRRLPKSFTLMQSAE